MARKIQLKETTIKADTKEEKDLVLNYKEQYVGILKRPVNGLDYEKIECTLRTIAKIKASKKEVLLEEDEWTILNNLIKLTKWSGISEELFDMIKNITEAKQEELVKDAQANM